MSYLKDGQIIVKLHGKRPQDVVSSISNLNDGRWHTVSGIYSVEGFVKIEKGFDLVLYEDNIEHI